MINENKIGFQLYLNAKNRVGRLENDFSNDEIKFLKRLFAKEYYKIVSDRGAKFQYGDKERVILRVLFSWSISSPDFDGDLNKGLYLMSTQGSGKDVFLQTVINFFAYFGKYFRSFSFYNFNIDFYNKGSNFFNMPLKISDINETGKIKRERISIPFLEFLDHREHANNRRGIIVSSNFGAKKLQDYLESDSPNPRLYERIKECFNILVIENIKSKRVENKITI